MKLFSHRVKDEDNKTAHLPLSAYLSYLLIATLKFTGVSFSKFAASASGSDSAGVACAIVQASGQILSAESEIDPSDINDKFEYQLTVSNNKDGLTSEVSLVYKIYIDLPADFPPMDIAVSNATKDEEHSTASQYIYTANDFLAAGTSVSKNHIISFKANSQTIGTNTGLDIRIYVKAEQLD